MKTTKTNISQEDAMNNYPFVNGSEERELRKFQEVKFESAVGYKVELQMGKDFGETNYYYVLKDALWRSVIQSKKKDIMIFNVPYDLIKYEDSNALVEKKLAIAAMLNKKYGPKKRDWNDIEETVIWDHCRRNGPMASFMGHTWIYARFNKPSEERSTLGETSPLF